MIKDVIQMSNKFNYKAQFRISYVELRENYGTTFSPYFVEKMKYKKVQNYLDTVLDAVFNDRYLCFVSLRSTNFIS
jgi:hypothetical protein